MYWNLESDPDFFLSRSFVLTVMEYIKKEQTALTARHSGGQDNGTENTMSYIQ